MRRHHWFPSTTVTVYLNTYLLFPTLEVCVNLTTVLIRFKAILLNNYEARGRFFWRLKNYVEVLVSHI